MSNLALHIQHLTKTFDRVNAVSDLSLEIPTGCFFGIVGPNGAGKTTTLLMATGLLIPDQGTAEVFGVDVWKHPKEARQLLGVMPTGFRLFDRLSGPDYLTYVAMLHGLNRGLARKRTEELLEALDLGSVGKKLITDYSAGMTKKIALGAALIHGPKVIVLDEPFESVDPISAQNITEILKVFVAQGGTVILSSHVMATVEELCDRVAIISDGLVIAAGTTVEVSAGIGLAERFASLIGSSQRTGGLSWLGN